MRLFKILLIAGATGVLLWLYGRGRDKEYEYPEQPEPLSPWWNVSTTALTMADLEDYYNSMG